jgi:SPP1 gp7 family putative phage head morphogenesis protein
MAIRRPPSDIAERSGGASANQRIADLFTGHAVDLLRVEAGTRRKVRALLNEMERAIVARLAAIDPTEPVRAAYRQKRLEALLEQVRETTRASYRRVSTEMAGELRELAEIEGSFVVSAINKGVGFQLATAVVTRQQLVSLVGSVLVHGAPVAEWWSRQAGDTLQRFSDEMRMGIALGETSQQLIQRIRGGTRNGELITGFMDISRRNADSLVRSATMAVTNDARAATYQANADILNAIVWTSTLDGRTSVQCQVRDGLRYTLDHKPIGHDVPWGAGPGNLHWGCRSTSRPETKSWRELGFDIDDLPAGTRASMSGQVAGDMKFEDWLSSRSKAEQDDALGKGRADLWRNGKISYRDLLDQNGRELSLVELRERGAA